MKKVVLGWKVESATCDEVQWGKYDCIMSMDGYTGEELRSGDIVTIDIRGSKEKTADQKMAWALQVPERFRVLIGNVGCELTFRDMYPIEHVKNVREMLKWAKWAYSLLGDRLVLAPMDFDIIHDVLYGGKFLRWAAYYKVLVVVFCGFRYFYRADESELMIRLQKEFPFEGFGNVYQYPFHAVKDILRNVSGEVWTGGGGACGKEGYGLRKDVMRRAEEFGFQGVVTTLEAWQGVKN